MEMLEARNTRVRRCISLVYKKSTALYTLKFLAFCPMSERLEIHIPSQGSIKPIYLVLTAFLSFWTFQLLIRSFIESNTSFDPFLLFASLYLVYHYLRGYLLFFRAPEDAALPFLAHTVDVAGLTLWCWGIFLLFRRQSPDLTKFIVVLETVIRLSPCLAVTVALFCLPCFLLVARNFRSPAAHLRGTPPAVVAKLRTGVGETGDSCPICLGEISGHPVTFLPCADGHAFHCACIAQWLDRSCLCPVCRANVVDLVTANNVPL